MVYLQITGATVILDLEDYEWAMGYNWHVKRGNSTPYAWRNIGGGHKIFMHREIMERRGFHIVGLVVHHQNHNGLDNRRCNLQIRTRAQNNKERRIQSNNTSGYKGVSFNKHSQKWDAYFFDDGMHRLGLFDDIEDAARAVRLARQARMQQLPLMAD